MLKNFSTLTVGDIISIEYNSKIFRMAVLETKPSESAINIVETDLSVDFAPPVGYVEPTPPGSGGSSLYDQNSRPASSIAKEIRKKELDIKDRMDSDRFVPFRGSGLRLSSKGKDEASTSSAVRSYATTPDVPEKDVKAGDDQEEPVPLELPIGTLFFGYSIVPPPGSELVDVNPDGLDGKFTGEGRVLRQRRTKRK
ncbi:ubiquitin fusion degradation protein [Dipsacomyces acuminosporus]|nr:ubiquitin fusion degradation protein [Dipsacomyces acuminosporus]